MTEEYGVKGEYQARLRIAIRLFVGTGIATWIYMAGLSETGIWLIIWAIIGGIGILVYVLYEIDRLVSIRIAQYHVETHPDETEEETEE